LLLLAVAAAYALSRARGAAPPTARSLAVLPFVNMSADPANAYFSDGLSEQIITALSHINGLRVAARTSSFALRDDKLDVRVIGDTLDVDAVLEGSVRRQGNRLRVTAQLIDATTGYHIWSDEYDREVADILAMQDEIAQAIASALELRLPARAVAARARRGPDPAAYDLYLRALHLRDDLSGDALQAGARLLDRAIELEPGFALAYATKAAIVAPGIYYGHVPREQGVAEMRVAIARALELDPELGEAHVALGMLELFFDWDWDGAERALRRALELNPSDPHAWHHLGNHLRAVGRLEEAVDARKKSVSLDPLNARMRIVLAMDLMVAGRLDEALAEYQRTQRLDPMIPQALGLGPYPPVGGRIHLLRGHNEEAVQELVRVAALRGATASELDTLRNAFVQRGVRGFWRSWLEMDLRQAGSAINPLRVSVLWAHTGDADQALDWLERAHAERNPGIIFLREEQTFAELRTHPRFVRIVQELKLPDR
jgi:TolB-like protein